MKKCKKCSTSKNLRLHAKARYKDKVYLYYKCVTCREEDGDVEKIAQRVKKWKQANPEKEAARKATFVAKRNGKLTRSLCEVCGEVNTEAHHTDYTKPLIVMWLCKKHHAKADKIRRSISTK